jgi:hypothetical protein
MFVAVMSVGMTVMGMAVAVNSGFRGRAKCRSGRCSGWAIVLVIATGMVVRVRIHSRYRPFYARCACLANGGCLLSGYLDT